MRGKIIGPQTSTAVSHICFLERSYERDLLRSVVRS